MDLPVIETPVFPRWVWMEEITYSHIPIATLVTAFMLLAPLFEYIGYRWGKPRWDRLSKSLIWFAMILFSPGAALGTGIPMFIIGTYPEFWSRWANLFFWPLIAQFMFFLAEVFFLFFLYYLTWDRWMHRKKLHITMGVCAAFFGYLVQIVWDSLGAYMLTPGGVPLPGVDEPVGWSLAAMLNPSFPFLLIHRTFGNFSYAMMLTGGVMSLRFMGQRRKDPLSENTAYFKWATKTCFTIGFMCFFAMPVIGWFYARVLQEHAPIGFLAMMGGHVTDYLTIKMMLISVFLVIGGTYVVKQNNSNVLTAAITLGLLILLVVILRHPPLDYFGGWWRPVSAGIVILFIAWLWLNKGRGDPNRTAWQYAIFIAGLAAFFTFCLGGFIRERMKTPDTVYGEIVKPEWTDVEADRYLVYEKWIHPLYKTPTELDRNRPDSWRVAVQQARQDGTVTLTDTEAETIINYLEANH
ncbi:MAG: cytochrome ubiquinol oxidase subunit I [Planctomycetota bacterium]|jgi:cytochrome bd-type quinol oxidase subunit 1